MWWNGRHGAFRARCLRACWFKSSHRHLSGIGSVRQSARFGSARPAVQIRHPRCGAGLAQFWQSAAPTSRRFTGSRPVSGTVSAAHRDVGKPGVPACMGCRKAFVQIESSRLGRIIRRSLILVSSIARPRTGPGLAAPEAQGISAAVFGTAGRWFETNRGHCITAYPIVASHLFRKEVRQHERLFLTCLGVVAGMAASPGRSGPARAGVAGGRQG